MLDLRQHIFYFIAIFLMLGVGILVGLSFYGPAQVRQQQTSLAHLRALVEGAVQEGRDAKDQLAKTEAALDAARPLLVHNKLAGRRIVLVQTGDYPDAVTAAAAALRDAGAPPAATLTLGDRWTSLAPAARSADLASLASVLTLGTADPARAASLQTLEDGGLVVLTGSVSSPSTLFVLIGGGRQDYGTDDTAQATLDTDLAARLQSAGGAGIVVVGCEPYAADFSSVPAFQQAQVSTVDCIDRPLGQLDLPFALRAGPDAADYGLKPTAARQFPVTLEQATP